jgi:DNA polymerase-3 subunit alpha (Gram-positive type)
MRSSKAENQPPSYYRATGNMGLEFAYLGEEKAYEVVVTNTNSIADMVEELQPIPSGVFLPQIDNAENDLVKICSARLYELYNGAALKKAKKDWISSLKAYSKTVMLPFI